MNPLCRIELLGGLRVRQADRLISRFRTQKAASLLAYLAYYSHQRHPREVLLEMLWPDLAPTAGRDNLSTTLSSLRHQLEPPGVPAGTVLVADRSAVGVDPAALSTDVADFQAHLKAAEQARSERERAQCLTDAVEVYTGPLLAGYDEPWSGAERKQLQEAYVQALRRLIRHLVKAGDLPCALSYAHRAVEATPLREEAHRDLMKLYVATGQPSAALEQYRDLETWLQRELGDTPSAATRQLAQEIQSKSQTTIPSEAPFPGGTAAPVSARRASAPDRPTPERLVQIGSPEKTPRPLSSPRSEAGYASTLPVPFTRFFGREEEITRLCQRLLPHPPLPPPRLVTLTGMGGAGKTRLALEVAQRLVEPFAGAVWFVSLVDLREAGQIPRALVEALRLPRAPQVEPLAQAVEALSGQPSLLVLDNFEHLVEEGTRLVKTLLERAPSLIVLVTSRQRLNLSGEQEFPLSPLPTPPRAEAPEPLRLFASVQLFVDRAQAVKPDFQVTNSNAAAIAELCQRLEGLPLALELAAARAQVLTPSQMLSQLTHRFDFLVSRRRDMEERHRTLWAAIDWSYQLLSPELQRFFARLSVFRGGWTLAAAESVCSEPFALDSLAQLRECSLVLAEGTGDSPEMRFRMLEVLRQYGGDRLRAAGEDQAVRARHYGFFLALAEDIEPQLHGPRPAEWLDRLEAENDNLRTALTWCSEQERGEPGLRLAGALADYWELRGPVQEGRDWLEKLLAQSASNSSPSARAKALYGAGQLARSQGDHNYAYKVLLDSLRLVKGLPDSKLRMARVLRTLGYVLLEIVSRSGGLQSSPLARSASPVPVDLDTLLLADCPLEQCRFSDARLVLTMSLQQYEALQDKLGIAHVRKALADLEYRLTNYAVARLLYLESLPVFQELEDRLYEANVYYNLAALSLHEGEDRAARMYAARSLEIYDLLKSRKGMVNVLDVLATIEYRAGTPIEAARLFVTAEALREILGVPPRSPEAWEDPLLHNARIGVAEAGLTQAITAPLSLEQIMAYVRTGQV